MMSGATPEFEPGKHPDLPPPNGRTGTLAWLRNNLFSSITNSILTIFAVWILYGVLPPIIDWYMISAVWAGSSAAPCQVKTGGAIDGVCWPFVRVWFWNLMTGQYPKDSIWRLTVLGLFIIIGFGWTLTPGSPRKIPVAVFMIASTPVISKALIYGGYGLPPIPVNAFGGLGLNLFYLVAGALWMLPLGILFALGRQSRLPVIRFLCLIIVQFFRGVPFIAILFASSVMLPLFFMGETNIDRISITQFGLTFYFSAYIAELIRAGILAVPKNKIETAKASGMKPWKITVYIILPEALRVTIPGLTNTTIGLLKATTLVMIIGQLDLISMVSMVSTSIEWLGFMTSGFGFAAIIYFCLSFGLVCLGRYLERKFQPDPDCKRNFATSPNAVEATYLGQSLA